METVLSGFMDVNAKNANRMKWKGVDDGDIPKVSYP